jgi:mannose-6-phosphate isomerase
MQGYKNKVFRLQGKVQHYDWGGKDFLPALLNIPNPENKPFAEYWMGAHRNGPSALESENNNRLSLDKFIAKDPAGTLGATVYKAFGRLPFLLKILDVRNMLSIQVHPTKKNAESAFAMENLMKVPLDSSSRNYKDDNHKPELMVALGDFWLLHGFKSPKTLENALGQVPELNFLINVFAKGNYKKLYREVMYMEQTEVDKTLMPLLNRILPKYQRGELKKNTEDFWAARAATIFNKERNIDRGIFSIYFFNLLLLKKGEGIFQDAGIPHAYLEGQNIEIMANSDNVLRAGLTTKHINVDELMKHVIFSETIPEIIHPEKHAERWELFPAPVNDFELCLLSLDKGERIKMNSKSLEIYFVLEGELLIQEEGAQLFRRGRGQAFLSLTQSEFSCESIAQSLLIRAGTRLGK